MSLFTNNPRWQYVQAAFGLSRAVSSLGVRKDSGKETLKKIPQPAHCGVSMVMALQLPYNPNRGCLSNGRGCSVIEYEKAKTVATTTTTPATNARFVPFTSNHSLADRIEAANIAIRSQAESRGLSFIDLNPLIATQGIRKLDMTTDGVHFTRKACLVWVDEIHQKINSFDAR